MRHQGPGPNRERYFVAILILSSALSLSVQEDPLLRAERLFAGRDEIAKLKQAVWLLEDLLARDPSNYEMLWRLAKYRNVLSDREEEVSRRLRLLEAGIAVAKKAIEIESQRPEGHFWFAANCGDYAGLKGVFQSLQLIPTIRREFEAALRIDPAYEHGNSYLALGELDLRLPKLLGGDRQRGIGLLEKGLKVGPNNAELKLTLAQHYARMGRKEEARRLIQRVLDLEDPSRTPKEQRELRSRAHRLLDVL